MKKTAMLKSGMTNLAKLYEAATLATEIAYEKLRAASSSSYNFSSSINVN
jgi:hypothetical protein